MKIFQHLKSFFFKPSKKLGLGVLLVLGAVAGIVGKVGFDETLHETGKEEFCVGCHTMVGMQEELKQTKHWKNQFGVTADCSACHLPHDTVQKYMRKVVALKEVYDEVTGRFDEPGSFEAVRYELAQKEWKRMSANGSAECKACHRYERMDFDSMSPKARKQMKAAAEKDQSCIDCHKGIAHHIPKAPEGEANSGIDPNLVASTLDADKVYYTQIQTPIYADEATKEEIGYLEGVAPVKFIKVGDNADLVELDMWRKAKGYGRIWYNDFAKSITDAVLTKAFMEKEPKFETLESREDPMTGIEWQKVKMQVWVKKGQLASDVVPIWEHAKELYDAQCSTCHKQPDIKHFDSNTWVGVFKGMVGFTNLDSTQAKQVLRYLQTHASDAPQQEAK